jgi:hypothetical protein
MKHKYTKQEAFDKVIKHLVKQGMPAVVVGQCKYQTDDGLKCAAGCLVERKSVREKLSGEWYQLIEEKPFLKGIADHKLIYRMQGAHDKLSNQHMHIWRKHWIDSMTEIAKEFKLKTTLLIKLATEDWILSK